MKTTGFMPFRKTLGWTLEMPIIMSRISSVMP